MTSITITVPVKAGQQAYFQLIFPKEKFMQIVEMTFATVQDVINGEKQGLYTIQK